MLSGSSRKIWIVTILTVVFILFAGKTASGTTTAPPQPQVRRDAPRAAAPPSPAEAKARLTEGFNEILDFFAERDFSLLVAWREMRVSGDTRFFEHKYPAISKELDDWAESLSRIDVSEASVGRMDFTFLLEELAPIALGPAAPETRRDNALLTICMVCMMDDLRCQASQFHRFLATVVAEDTSPARRAEALRWWRATGGFIDEGLLESVLMSSAGNDLDLRSEVARTLFSITTRRSLQAQRLLATTDGLPEDASGAQTQIACTAIRHFASAGYRDAAPGLIDALQDPSREVRACAAESLSRLSGLDFGFDPAIDSPANLEAIARWRAWWSECGSAPTGVAR